MAEFNILVISKFVERVKDEKLMAAGHLMVFNVNAFIFILIIIRVLIVTFFSNDKRLKFEKLFFFAIIFGEDLLTLKVKVW